MRHNRVLTFFRFISVLAFFFSGFLPLASKADVRRLTTSLEKHRLKMEILNDRLIHFELTSTETPDNPIATTPYVAKKDFGGPEELQTTSNTFETSLLKMTVDPRSLCITAFDKKQGKDLTTFCPIFDGENPVGMTLAKGSIENIYGLGEQFRSPGQVNGDWVGEERTPGASFGNALVGFQGGYVGNAQFPILYALGPENLNYALFVDHTSAQTWDFKKIPWKMTTRGKTLRWYFIAGASLPELRAQYMELVGLPPVPPKKALGLWVSEFGYRDWQEMLGKLKTLRQNHFPVDGFVLDVYWFGAFNQSGPGNNFGRFAFDESHFPQPAAMMTKLRQKEGIGIATIEDPYVNSNLPEYGVLSDRGYFVRNRNDDTSLALESWWGRGSMIDWTNPQASAFWHDTKRQAIIDAGVMIHWTDLAEPETYNSNARYWGLPSLDGDGEEEDHNIYALKWSESIAQGYARNAVKRRPFILARSGGPGSQRYGVALWSGDIGSNLKSLSSHLNVQMHMSLSGIDYFGSDTGGFHREALEGDLNEVYTRWLAHSSLYDVPIRPHTDNGSKKNNTPPDRIGDLKSNLFNIRQRYQLSPYYYSLAYRAHLYGEPVLPPPLFYFQSDETLRTVADEKMIGPFLLSATASQDGERERAVYLPAGTWMDLHTLKWYPSRGESFNSVPEFQNGIFRLPLFIREGAILPEMKVDGKTMNILGRRTDSAQDETLRLKILPSRQLSSFTLYEDDGETVAYLSGDTATTLISQKLEPLQSHADDSHEKSPDLVRAHIIVGPTRGHYIGQPLQRAVRAEIYLPAGKAKTITLNLKELPKRRTLSQLEKEKSGWFQGEGGSIVVQTPVLPASLSKEIEILIQRGPQSPNLGEPHRRFR